MSVFLRLFTWSAWVDNWLCLQCRQGVDYDGLLKCLFLPRWNVGSYSLYMFVWHTWGWNIAISGFLVARLVIRSSAIIKMSRYTRILIDPEISLWRKYLFRDKDLHNYCKPLCSYDYVFTWRTAIRTPVLRMTRKGFERRYLSWSLCSSYNRQFGIESNFTC
jgi:hypothetical protein